LIYKGAIARWSTTDAAADLAPSQTRRGRLSVVVLAISLALMLAPPSVAVLALSGVLT
jgi:hypothetical protein